MHASSPIPARLTEQAAAYLAKVHRLRIRLHRVHNRPLRPAIDFQLPGKAISRSGRNDRERNIAERQGRCHFVNRPISAPRHHETGPTLNRRSSEQARMSWPFGYQDVGYFPVFLDGRRCQLAAGLRAAPGRVRPATGLIITAIDMKAMRA